MEKVSKPAGGDGQKGAGRVPVAQADACCSRFATIGGGSIRFDDQTTHETRHEIVDQGVQEAGDESRQAVGEG